MAEIQKNSFLAPYDVLGQKVVFLSSEAYLSDVFYRLLKFDREGFRRGGFYRPLF